MKILFCSDGSSQAQNAVRFGALIASACQAETSILGIVESAGQEDAVLPALRRAQEILKESHLNAELITKSGQPVRLQNHRIGRTAGLGGHRRPCRAAPHPALHRGHAEG
jgi:hypothetical protein